MTRRLAFSTLGAPHATADDIVRIAELGGCSGVELRSAFDEAVHAGMDAAAADDFRESLSAHGVAIIAVNSYVQLCGPEDDGVQVADLEAQLELAARLGAIGVRVFMGDSDGTGEPRALGRIAAVGDLAARLGVAVLIETHDSHRRSEAVVDFLRRARSEGPCPLGVIWDTGHTWAAGESPAESFAVLAPEIAYIQIKDVVSRTDLTPVLPGTGDYPIEELTETLVRADWAGWVSLECERRWHPELPPVDVALATLPTWADGMLTPASR